MSEKDKRLIGIYLDEIEDNIALIKEMLAEKEKE